MLTYIQHSRRVTSFCYFLFKQHQKPVSCSTLPVPLASNISIQAKLFTTLQPKKTNCSVLVLSRQVSRNQKNNESNYNEDDSDESDEEDDDTENIEGVDVKTYRAKSLRADSFLKLVFGCTRRHFAEEFYKQKIRLNEKILKKKSVQVKTGDTVDLFLKFAPHNPNFIYVNRVEVLKVMDDPDSDKILVKVQKMKSLLIENYSDGNTLQIEDS